MLYITPVCNDILKLIYVVCNSARNVRLHYHNSVSIYRQVHVHPSIHRSYRMQKVWHTFYKKMKRSTYVTRLHPEHVLCMYMFIYYVFTYVSCYGIMVLWMLL